MPEAHIKASRREKNMNKKCTSLKWKKISEKTLRNKVQFKGNKIYENEWKRERERENSTGSSESQFNYAQQNKTKNPNWLIR